MAKKYKTPKSKTLTLILSVTDKDKDKVIATLTRVVSELGLTAVIVIKPEFDIRLIEKGREDNANVKA